MDFNFTVFIVFLASILIEVALPIFLAVYLIKKYPNAWVMIVAGVFTFSLSLLAQIPALNGINKLVTDGVLPARTSQFGPYIYAGLVGLVAAMIEEAIRWIGFRLMKDYAKPFRSGFSLGVGHGGAELVIQAALLAFSFGSVLFFNPAHQLNKGISMATVQANLESVRSFWAAVWWPQLVDIFNKLVKFSAQIVFSLLVWRSVTKDSPTWFIAALLYHTVISGVPTLLSDLHWTYWQSEGILAVFFLLNILIFYWYWGDQGGLDSEGEDDEDEDEEEGEEPAKGKALPAKKTVTSARKAAGLTKKAAVKNSAAKKPAAKKPAANTK